MLRIFPEYFHNFLVKSLVRMRLRKLTAIFCAICCLAFVFILYVMTDLSLKIPKVNTGMKDFDDGQWSTFDSKLKHIELELSEHNALVGEIKSAVNKFVQQPVLRAPPDNSIKIDIKSKAKVLVYSPQFNATTCAMLKEDIPYADIQMLSLYESVNFNDQDGGVWKQGFEITYNHKQWSKKNKLKVIIVPHSHNDPGWLKTFDEYYKTQTRSIFNNMVEYLSRKPGRKFIWAEMSYLSQWWNNDATTKQKVMFQNLLRNGQIEIVTGGWVMNDEANSHWLSIVQQLSTGHQWLIHALDYIPKNSWAIDPFGHSGSQPYILKLSGLQNAVIQRVHYFIKKELASLKQLEFNWRQLWDGIGKTDMFTHMMPFYSYDIPHSCGPDPMVCCQFDFRRLPGQGITCPWQVHPQRIRPKNVDERSNLILDQWRKKAQLYRSNVVMFPLGDDFRYDRGSEWEDQYMNYELLIDYINSREDFHTEVQFGTLEDYFHALHNELSFNDFPVLSGDFFTYADRGDNYWSGYYTTRPFYKRMDRVLMNYVRAAEIISAQAMMAKSVNSMVAIQLRDRVEAARQTLALFQHHDGVTGTSKHHVRNDYAKKLLTAIKHCQSAIQDAAYHLLNKPEVLEQKQEDVYFNVDDVWMSHEELPSRITIALDEISRTRRIVLYNGLTYRRQEVFSVIVSQPYVELLDADGKPVNIQVSPVVTGSVMLTFPLNKYRVTFLATVEPLALTSYTIHLKDDKTYNPKHVYFASVRVNDEKLINVNLPKVFTAKSAEINDGNYMVRNGDGCRMFVAGNGLLAAVASRNNHVFPLEIQLMSYGSPKGFDGRSGAYLFHPDGPAKVIGLQRPVEIVILEGPIVSTVYTLIVDTRFHTQFLITTTLTNNPSLPNTEVEISNTMFIEPTEQNDREVFLRLRSDVQNGHDFYTDLNGMQMIKRQTFDKLPLQGNFYPLPAAMYIADDVHRVSVLTSTPLGVAVNSSGRIDIMQDRKLLADDNRGLGEGITDNLRTKHTFRLVFENLKDRCHSQINPEHPSGQLSLGAHVSQQSLLHPLIAMHYTPEVGAPAPARDALTTPLGADIILASYRSDVMGKIKDDTKIKGFGMTFQRTFFDNCYENPVIANYYKKGNGAINITDITKLSSNVNIYECTLTHTRMKDQLRSSILATCPMEIRSVFVKHTPDY